MTYRSKAEVVEELAQRVLEMRNLGHHEGAIWAALKGEGYKKVCSSS